MYICIYVSVKSSLRQWVSGLYKLRPYFPKSILQTFSEAIRFNADYGVFEVVNNAPQLLEKQLKKILRNQQPRNPIYDVVRKGKNDIKPVQMNAPYENETINVNYNIMVRKYTW